MEKSRAKEETGQLKYDPRVLYTIMMGLFAAAKRVKSIRRSIKRGKISMIGTFLPKRPFNNRANTSKRKGVHSRVMNEQKKKAYGFIKRKAV